MINYCFQNQRKGVGCEDEITVVLIGRFGKLRFNRFDVQSLYYR